MIPWVTGDIITAEKLNAIPNVMIARYTSEDGQNFTCDKTFAELAEWIENDGYIFCKAILNGMCIFFELEGLYSNVIVYKHITMSTQVQTVQFVSQQMVHSVNEGIEDISFSMVEALVPIAT